MYKKLQKNVILVLTSRNENAILNFVAAGQMQQQEEQINAFQKNKKKLLTKRKQCAIVNKLSLRQQIVP